MYYFNKRLEGISLEGAVEKVQKSLSEEGFGILTDIDISATLKNKLDVDFRPYRILGACNPPLAHKALSTEPHIGLMLPCNVVVQEAENGVDVSAIDPLVTMQSVGNKELEDVAGMVRTKLSKVVESL
jgi:uncharacterized protein (DUF302 family)